MLVKYAHVSPGQMQIMPWPCLVAGCHAGKTAQARECRDPELLLPLPLSSAGFWASLFLWEFQHLRLEAGL